MAKEHKIELYLNLLKYLTDYETMSLADVLYNRNEKKQSLNNLADRYFNGVERYKICRFLSDEIKQFIKKEQDKKKKTSTFMDEIRKEKLTQLKGIEEPYGILLAHEL